MRLIRNFFRKVKYEIRFLLKTNMHVKYIKNLNVDKKLTELMNYHGSDKGGRTSEHNYSDFYSEIFLNNKNDIKNFLEIGLGTNNISLQSNMGKNGIPLASLRAWRDYFPNANIYGADIDRKILKNENRIKTFYVDQTDPNTIFDLFSQIKVKEFDVIIEDGLHEFSANICFFENSIKYLSKTGIYIIEDIYYKDYEKFINYFKKKEYNFSIINIYHSKNISNNCLVIIKK